MNKTFIFLYREKLTDNYSKSSPINALTALAAFTEFEEKHPDVIFEVMYDKEAQERAYPSRTVEG